MPFNPDAYLSEKVAFNPDSYLAEKTTQHSMGEKANAGLQGLGNFVTGGLLPYAQAGFAASTQDPTYDIDKELRAKGYKIDQPEWNSFSNQLSGYQKDKQQIIDTMPEQYYGGELAGAGLVAAGTSGMAAGPIMSGAKAVGSGLLQGAKSQIAKETAKYSLPALSAYLTTKLFK